jgi:hypothetical protein
LEVTRQQWRESNNNRAHCEEDIYLLFPASYLPIIYIHSPLSHAVIFTTLAEIAAHYASRYIKLLA